LTAAVAFDAMAEGRHTGAAYYLTAGVLIFLLVGGIALVMAMVMRPEAAPPSALVSTNPKPVDCPTKTEGVTCFESDVTNTGGSTGDFTCTVDAGEVDATFPEGGGFTEVTIAAGASVPLTSIVENPKKGRAPVPSVRCAIPRT
jgi:hypothetical protein